MSKFLRLVFAIIMLRTLEASDFKQCDGKCDDVSGYEAFCIGGLLEGNLAIQNVTISNWCENTFNLTYLGLWPNLRYFALIQSPVTNFVGAIPKSSKLQIIVLNNLTLENFEALLFKRAYNLTTLSLRNNNFRSIPSNIAQKFPRLKELYIGGNPIHCTNETWENTNWMWDNPLIKDFDDVICSKDGPVYNKKPLKLILRFIKEALDSCPPGCKCILPHVVNYPRRGLTPLITVYCDSLTLTDFPTSIPINTTTIHLEDNRISNTKALEDNLAYSKVADVYLDNNLVSSIDNLEGSNWFTQFRILSLRFNKLTSIPSYALNNVLERNKNAVRLLLGNNPLVCECESTPIFQELLLKYQALIKDSNEINCINEDDAEFSLKPVRNISLNDVCRSSRSFHLDLLFILNWTFISLTVLILSKLLYDYYFYKKTGKLPWISAKMP